MIADRFRSVVCFSCGNAAGSLRDRGLDVIECGPGPHADFRPDRWWTPAEIREGWPGRFDATPGHLDAAMMSRLADRFRRHLADRPGPLEYVPTGSGETILALGIAYPDVRWVAVYNLDHATRFHCAAPLNRAVADRFKVMGVGHETV